MEKSKTSFICKTSDHRAKRNEIWDSRVVGSSSTYMGYLRPVAFTVILRSFGALSIFRNLGLMIRDRRNISSDYNS